MFLRAGVLSLALLLASRLLGVLREGAQAAAFGATGVADLAVLLLTLPDWMVAVSASGALAYVLLPAWAGRTGPEVAALQRRVAFRGGLVAVLAAVALVLAREPAVQLLAGGLPRSLHDSAARALVWSAVAVPAAFLAALWSTRLQHHHDLPGMYGGNLVVNACFIATIAVAGHRDPATAVTVLGGGLVLAMALRLAWLAARLPRSPSMPGLPAGLPSPPVWLWAILTAGLPLALPFMARSMASQAGPGALATFNYAWKLVELPSILAVQLVASLAFPRVAAAMADGRQPVGPDARPMRSAFALAFTLACAAAAGLLLGAPAVAQLLFGWGRMDASALTEVAEWGRVGGWGLLPQAVCAVAVTILAAQRRLAPVVAAYLLVLVLLLAVTRADVADGQRLMLLLNAAYGLVALCCLAALGASARHWVPWRAALMPLVTLAGVGLVASLISGVVAQLPVAAGLACGGVAAAVVLGGAWLGSEDVRRALQR